ncbi:MAG: sporulation protein Cse60 [Oscillospiraceae bacterium]|nr:sporulation protein Cse60 [Oscillospiraceae bacterium]
MIKIKLFDSEYQRSLEREVNEFCQNRDVISVSYSTQLVGYSVFHYCCVCYREEERPRMGI